jgi:signal transduction histidine kinase/CheY-like chemotaxis protein
MIPLLTTVMQALRQALGFDIAVAVLCEDDRRVVPVFTTGKLAPSVVEGLHVQALAAFTELAGPDQATWAAEDPTVIRLEDASEMSLAEPEAYEDAPLVIDGQVRGLIRVACPQPLSAKQRRLFFAVARDLSKAFEETESQRIQTRMVQDRLLQSEKMSSIGQLVSGVAHELNNPLTGIMGFAQLLLLRDLEAPIRQQVETIYGEAERASKIVANLLTFARRRDARKETANLNTLIERVLELRNYDLRVRNITVELDTDPALPDTLVDTNQILQVFLNLLINAEQAMRPALEGGSEGMLRITTRQPRAGTILVSFADSGSGMNDETLRRIFDPFFTTKDAGEGTGLGLAISYGIVDEHGGRIWAESAIGKGTTFHIELPVLAGTANPPVRAAEPEPSSSGERRRILVVDDEEAIQKLLTGVLEMDGHDVSVAGNGREALEKVGSQPFDLIISDIKMPIMGGADMYRRLRDDNNPLAKRVIFVTGDTVAPDTRKFLQEIDNTVLSKPFRLRDVRESVAAALAR